MRIVCQTGEVLDLIEPLPGSHIKEADLHRVILERASFDRTVFESCNLRSGLLALSSGLAARFVRCTLVLAGFQAADLRGAHFEGGDGYGCDFTGANLGQATVTDTRFEASSFRGCNLDGTDLSNADLAGTFLEGALYTLETHWPAGFDPLTSGAVLIGDQTRAFEFLDATFQAPDPNG